MGCCSSHKCRGVQLHGPFLSNLLRLRPIKRLIPVLLLLFLTIAGCSDGRRNNETPFRESAESGKDLPVIDNEDLTSGLKGIDADGNGIRDDVDRLIAMKYSTTSMMKQVAELHARALQQSMGATTREQAKAAGNEIFRAGPFQCHTT